MRILKKDYVLKRIKNPPPKDGFQNSIGVKGYFFLAFLKDFNLTCVSVLGMSYNTRLI